LSEIFRVRRGIGAFGKLWTGDRPEDGALVTYPKIVLRSCRHCGCTTNQFRASAIETTTPEAFAKMPLRDLWLFAGGVGSLPDLHPFAEGLDVPSILTNWSGRIGGLVLIAPEAVTSARVSGDEPLDAPYAPAGYAWHIVYAGETLRQWVMLPASGEIPDDREIEVVCPRGPAGDGSYTCPRCREAFALMASRGESLDDWHQNRTGRDLQTVLIRGSWLDSRLYWRESEFFETTWYHGEPSPTGGRLMGHGVAEWATGQSRRPSGPLTDIPDGLPCEWHVGGDWPVHFFHSGWDQSFAGDSQFWHRLRRPALRTYHAADNLVAFDRDGVSWYGYTPDAESDVISANEAQGLTKINPHIVEVRRLDGWRLGAIVRLED
jgi:hypothetical protein